MAETQDRGKKFEAEVEKCLRAVETRFPFLVHVSAQVVTSIGNERDKVVDFVFQYRTWSSRNEIAIECQDRQRWESDIIEKITVLRLKTHHNRFWYVYRDDGFLTGDAVAALDREGIMHFSLSELKEHLDAIAAELEFAWIKIIVPAEVRLITTPTPANLDQIQSAYRAPADPAMSSPPLPKFRF